MGIINIIKESYRKTINFFYNVYKWRTILCNDYDWDYYYSYMALYFKICNQIKWFEQHIEYYKKTNDYNIYCKEAKSIRYMKISKHLLELTYIDVYDELPNKKINIRKKDIPNYYEPKYVNIILDPNNTDPLKPYLIEQIYRNKCKKLLHKILLDQSCNWSY